MPTLFGPRVIVLSLLVACLASVTTGCQSTSRTRLDEAVRAYDAGEYNTARDRASRVLADAQSSRRYEASYLVGISSYQLGYIDEAERRLTFSSKASNKTVRGRSKAMLGRIRLDQKRYREADALLTSASELLDGSDAARARDLAMDARTNIRTSERTTSAQTTMYAAPESSIAVEPFNPDIQPVASATVVPVHRFALQIGAFADEYRALAAARDAQRVADTHGLGLVRTLPRMDSRGRTLYIVQMGSFENRFAADRARSRIGSLELIVAQEQR